MDLFPNNSGLGLMKPIALINYNVCLLAGSVKHYRKVTWFESIPPFQFLNIGAIGAATVSGRTQATNLALADGEFGQYRWAPIDNVQVNLFLPQTNGRSVLRNLQVPVDIQIATRDPDLHFTEIYVWEDRVPWFEARNSMDYALLTARLVGAGFRFITEPLEKAIIDKINLGQAECLYLPCFGQAGQVE